MIIFLYFTTHTILHSEAPNGELKEDVERLENEKFLYFHDALPECSVASSSHG